MIVYDGEDITRLPTHQIMRKRHRPVAGGTAHLPAHDRLREPADGRAGHGAARDFDVLLEQVFAMFPRLKERVQPARGHALGRGAADARDRPGADVAARGCCCWTSRASASRRWWCGISSAPSASLNRETGLTVLLVEQNAFQALRLAHRGYVLVNGAITMAGSGAELLARPGDPRGLSGRGALRGAAAFRQRRAVAKHAAPAPRDSSVWAFPPVSGRA